MTQDPRPAISFHNLTLGYDRHPAVHHITGDVARGELLALVGPNGAGKVDPAQGHCRARSSRFPAASASTA